MDEVEAMEHPLHAFDGLEFLEVLLVRTPGLGEQVLYALQAPEEVEDLFIRLHDVLGEDSTQRSQITYNVVQRENLPALVTRGALQ